MTAEPRRPQSVTDLIDPARAVAMHATLNRHGAPPGEGDTLPDFWHQAYFWQTGATASLGPDGHERLGELIPDLGLPQRMWAGGRLTFHLPLRIGQPAEKLTAVDWVSQKQGRTGRLGFVTLRHEFRQAGRLCVTEFQDLVYRDPPDRRAEALPPMARTDAEEVEEIGFSTTALFRYSALMFNAHRIHYDLDYCAGEGHAGAVVHGPLLAQVLLDFAEAALGALNGFRFRATAPLYHFETAEICRAGGTLWIRGPDGRQCMEAEAS
jgi:3-methylfumaryl-CoA hydratase